MLKEYNISDVRVWDDKNQIVPFDSKTIKILPKLANLEDIPTFSILWLSDNCHVSIYYSMCFSHVLMEVNTQNSPKHALPFHKKHEHEKAQNKNHAREPLYSKSAVIAWWSQSTSGKMACLCASCC